MTPYTAHVPSCAQCGFVSDGPFRFCPECGHEAATAEATREQRRTVTVVFCDLAGSTALGETVDPERLRALLARYFERMKGIVESHGGSVEKFIGDAVMCVFGVPIVHEDDALRAVRAADEMRRALPELGLEGRIGVMTGEVVAGTAERLVTGDAVNVAARLEQAAQPGEVLLGSRRSRSLPGRRRSSRSSRSSSRARASRSRPFASCRCWRLPGAATTRGSWAARARWS